MPVSRLIVIGCVAAVISGLFGYFVLFEPDQATAPAAPSVEMPSTSEAPPVSTTTTPEPRTTNPPPTVAAPTTTPPPPDSSNRGRGKNNKKTDGG